MKVILLQYVDGLGKAGDIKEVKNGYGLNFLLPEGLAELATPQTIKQAEKFIAKRAKEFEALATDLKAAATALEGQRITIKTKAEGNKLFGSVGREEIAAALKVAGKSVEVKMIVLDKPIKEIGTFAGTVNFGHGIKAAFEVIVEAE
jgi:large subunit ribosomal protein L9